MNPKGNLNITLLIALGLVILAAGIIAVSWYAVESLHETDKKLKTYKVQPATAFHPKSIELEGAEDILKKYDMAMDHPEAEKYFRAASTAKDTGKYALAVDLYKKSLAELTKDYGVRKYDHVEKEHIAIRYEAIARCYLNILDLKNALTYVTKSIELRPDRSAGYRLRYQVLMQMGKTAEATRDLDRVVKSDQDGTSRSGIMEDLVRKESN